MEQNELSIVKEAKDARGEKFKVGAWLQPLENNDYYSPKVINKNKIYKVVYISDDGKIIKFSGFGDCEFSPFDFRVY